MGLLGSSLGRALAGAGSGISELGGKYIDEQLAERRAQVLADIARTSAVQQTKEIDTYTNAPERRAGLRTEAGKDIEAAGASALKGKIAESTSPELLVGDVARTKAITTAAGMAQGETAKKLGNDPLYVAAERNIARAKHVDSVAEVAHASLLSFQLGMAKQQAALQDSMFRAISSGDKETEDQTREKLDVLLGKGGKGERFARIAEQAAATMGPALKTLSDPTADDGVKEQARTVLRQQQALLQQAAKRAGFDLSEAAKTPIPQAAMDALKADPSKARDFDAKYGPGESAKIIGSSAAPKPGAPASGGAGGASIMSTVNDALTGGDQEVARRRAAVGSLFDKAGVIAGRVGDTLSPDWEQQGQSALASRDKGAMQRVLQQSQGAVKPMSPATRIKLEAALRAP